ncbi:MAG: flagellar protein export ATPase FliI [Rhizobiaceae bacterium]
MTGQASSLDRLAAGYRQFRDSGDMVLSGGRVVAISPNHFRVKGLAASSRLGDVVHHDRGPVGRRGEVIRIDGTDITVAPFRDARHLTVGAVVVNRGPLSASPGDGWLGRVVDALGEPVDGKGPLLGGEAAAHAETSQPTAMQRGRVDQPFRTGVRVIDIFTPLCYGQRFGLFAGSGVGKSTLLAMLARADAFDVIVVALVGERGREVREFIEETFGPGDMAKAIVVLATSDESAMMRRRAPECALQIAEHFRDRGKRVLLLLDSVTRYAHALREVAISIGEPPVARGYPASVFTELPRMLERAGPGAEGGGSITAIITVLVDGDDHNDPVADAVRGILDGHLVMDRQIADQGRYPAVNPLASISRLANRVWREEEKALVLQLRSMIHRFEETRDLRLLGAWQPGADAALDKAVETVPAIYDALCQEPSDPVSSDPFADLITFLKGGAVVPDAAKPVDVDAGGDDG